MKVKLTLKGKTLVTYEGTQVVRVTVENTTKTCDVFITDECCTLCTRDNELIEWEMHHLKRRREKP